MPEIILSDYFYGDESEEFVFFKIPRQLITNPKFKHVSTDAKLLYGMLLDRMSLSARNNWYDSDTSPPTLCPITTRISTLSKNALPSLPRRRSLATRAGSLTAARWLPTRI